MNVQDLVVKVQEVDSVQGVTLLNVLELPEPLVKVLTEVMRHRAMTLTDFAQALGIADEAEAQILADLLVEKGFLRTVKQRQESVAYRVRFDFSTGRGMSSSVWDSFDS
ncbi:MAG: hypothetical protein KDE51_04185 [Anaerolineales bacterium]|nr:hypothetical protein [Anaerolineales bacterium]